MTSHVVQNNKNNNQEKDRWCKLVYADLVKNWLIGTNINPKKILGNVPQCRFGDNCYYAHCREEIILLKYLKNFNDIDKSEIDIYNHYFIMKNLIIKNKGKLTIKQKKIVNDLNLENFINVLRLWRDLNCEYSRFRKEWRSNSSSRFKFRHEIPSFEYEDSDLMWALYKYTKKCEQFMNLKSKISTKSKLKIDELCRRDKNCKNGCHENNEMICIDDLIKGSCNCKYKTRSIIIDKLKIAKNYSNEEKELTDNLYSVKRHLTLEGLIPFNIAKDTSESDKKLSSNTLDSKTLEKKMKEGLSLKERINSNKKRLSFLKKD